MTEPVPTLPPWVKAARDATPGVAHVTHFNNAGAALPSAGVLAAVTDHLQLEATIGGYEAAGRAADRLQAVRTSTARMLGAGAHEIALVDSATRAWGTAVAGFPFAAGDRVLTGRSEYVSNALLLLQLRDRIGIEIVLLDDDEAGQVSLDHLEQELARGAAMVALTQVPTNGGLVNPAAEVGERCRAHGAWFVLDACQSLGQLPLDVGDLGCDVLAATGRKFLRAPRGTGVLYVREDRIEQLVPPTPDLQAADWTDPWRFALHDDARRFELYEHSTATRLGLGVAVDEALALDAGAAWTRIQALGARIRVGLAGLDGVTVHDKGAVRCGIVTFTVAGHDAEAVQRRLHDDAVNTWVSVAEHARFDMPERGLRSLVRASAHYFNTEGEVDRLVELVAAVAEGGRADESAVTARS